MLLLLIGVASGELTSTFSSFAGQSLAREFGPQGIHVAHTILDGENLPLPRYECQEAICVTHPGFIDTPALRERFGEADGEGTVSPPLCPMSCFPPALKFSLAQRLSPESIAAAYVYLSQQDKSCWTQGEPVRNSPRPGFSLTRLLCIILELDLRPYTETF
jgi:hypothetical protein